MFQFSGAAFLAVGLYIMLSRHSFVSLLGGTMFPVTTYLIVATGVLIIVIGCVGCFGACQENRCLLFTVSESLFNLSRAMTKLT
jgi:hypothetical protein